MDEWPFADPPDVACVTVREVMDGRRPILLVAHDADDGGWQFLTGGPFDVADGLLVSLSGAVRRDRSLLELADLPPGWEARREAPGSPWRRAPSESSDA